MLAPAAAPTQTALVRIGVPGAVSGSVFGAIELRYEQRDRRDRTIGRERHLLRFFAGAKNDRTFTWEIRWAACCGPIPATGPGGRAPAMRAQAATATNLTVGPGWTLDELSARRPALALEARRPARAFALYQEAGGIWAPLYWRAEAQDRLFGSCFRDGGGPDELKAGETGVTEFCGVLAPLRRAAPIFARRRADFDAPPSLREC
jgi:hypothetical protein